MARQARMKKTELEPAVQYPKDADVIRAAARGTALAKEYEKALAFIKPIAMAKLEAMMPSIMRESEKQHLVFESVWVREDEEYHKRLHDWLLNCWCWHDIENRKFVWRHSLNDFGFIIFKLSPVLAIDRRYEKLAEEWRFDKLHEGLSEKAIAKKIKDACSKVDTSGEYYSTPELNNVPLP
jgi:hypothetical protein